MTEAKSDLFVVAKLNFFSFVGNILEPSLRKYQSNKPLLPYLDNDLKSMVKELFLFKICLSHLITKLSLISRTNLLFQLFLLGNFSLF